jgi:subtilase family serine protease
MLLMLLLIILIVNLIIINAIGKSIYSSISSCKDSTYIHREKSRFIGIPFINEESTSSSSSSSSSSSYLSISKYDKHIVIFAVKQNYDELEKKLFDVSIPSSINYRKHLTREEVGAISINPSYVDQVLNILSSIDGLEIISKTIDGEYITVQGNVELFEAMFQSSFHKFTYKEESAIRMKEYSLPKCLSDVVGGVLNVVDLPFDFEKSSKAKTKTPSTSFSEKHHRNLQTQVTPTKAPTRSPTQKPTLAPTRSPTQKPTLAPTRSPTYTPGVPTPEPSFQPTSFPTFNGIPVPTGCTTGAYGSTYCDSLTTIASPQFVSALFNIQNNTGVPSISQAVYEDGQTISIADLNQFQTTFGLPLETIIAVNGGGTESEPCFQGFSGCGEANLDAQYLTALAQNIPTETWWYDNTISNLFNGFIIQMANSTDPPLVMSISYAWYEAVYTSEQLNQWNTEAMKLGIQGVTILAAAGDAGVAGPFGGFEGPSYCGYGPLFPASSPYVTTVGGTQGYPDQVPSQCDLGGLITTGGGFSNQYSTPSWQESNVASYFANVSPKPYNTSDISIDDFYSRTDSVIISGTYNPYGRGYPDVSAWSSFVWVNIGGDLYEVAGTSVATPVFAAMVSLTNAANTKKNVGAMGWLNPFLYEYADSFVTDIFTGNNRCLEQEGCDCCDEGFYASTGWDPVSGLGLIDFELFAATALSTHPTYSPTRSPTLSPTYLPGSPTPEPTPTPTVRPTRSPTPRPTVSPTLSPTAYPTYGPSYVYINYYVDETCYGEVMFQHAYLTNYCQPDGPTNSFELSCSPEGVTVTAYESTDCSGTPYQMPVTTLSCDRSTAIQCNIGTDIEDIVLMDSGILTT